MTGVQQVMSLVAVSLIWSGTPTSGDSQLSCVFMDTCTLPCSFQPATEELIHWVQLQKADGSVHSYYNDQDQLSHQDGHFSGRTFLFRDQISKGNASLRLSKVNVQDEGRYKCYTSTTLGNKETFISLKVKAPVSKINIQQVDNTVTCSSKGIYPEPNLTWSTSPPSDLIPQKPSVQRNQQGLFDISSSLLISANNTQTAYSCTITTDSSTRKGTLSQLPPVTASSDTLIPCNDKNSDLRHVSLTWRFNHSEIILTKPPNQVQVQAQESWKEQVKGLSESGSLELRASAKKREGIYTCELSDDISDDITNTLLEIDPAAQQAGGPNIVTIVVVVVVIIGLVVGLILYNRCKKRTNRSSSEPEAVSRGGAERGTSSPLMDKANT